MATNISDVVRYDHLEPKHRGIFVLNWNLGNVCNYSCSYCPDILNDGSRPWADSKVILGFCDKVIAHYREKLGRTIYLEFTGGEVTLKKDFIEMALQLKQRNCLTGIISNGSRPLAFWEKCKPALDHICLSYHAEFAKKDHFLKVVDFLHDGVTTHINIMMKPDRFDECLDVAETLASRFRNISINIQPLFEKLLRQSELQTYSESQIRILSNREFHVEWTAPQMTYRGYLEKRYADGRTEAVSMPRLIATEENNWSGWNCWAGLDQLVVSSEGKVMRGWCGQDPIGSIHDAEITFPTVPTLCRKDHCYSGIDIMNRKERSGSSVVPETVGR